jgi:hypothetical protein
MAIPPLPILVGGGAIIATIFGIGGFVLAVRTQLTPIQLALLVGGLVSLTLSGLLLSESVRTGVTILAYMIMLGFPLYALFWIVHDFTERVVRT